MVKASDGPCDSFLPDSLHVAVTKTCLGRIGVVGRSIFHAWVRTLVSLFRTLRTNTAYRRDLAARVPHAARKLLQRQGVPRTD